MSRRSRSIVTTLLIVATLALPLSAQAGELRGFDPMEPFWSWLKEVWGSWSGVSGSPSDGLDSVVAREGVRIDPDGEPTASEGAGADPDGAASASGPLSSTWEKEGAAVDPVGGAPALRMSGASEDAEDRGR